MLTEEDLSDVVDRIRVVQDLGFTFEDVTDLERMDQVRKIAVGLALMGKFDDQVEELLKRSD